MRLLLVIWCLLLAGIFCISQGERTSANWQSRDSNYNISTGGPSCVLPTFSGALVAHWTGDSGITQVSNQVSQWTDTVAGLNLTQATGANQPKYLATGYNGHPAIQLYGSTGSGGFSQSSMATAANALTWTNLSFVFSYFIVGQLLANTDATGFGRFLSFQGTGATNDSTAGSIIPFLRNGTVDSIVPYLGSSSGTPISISENTNYRLGGVYDQTNLTPYVNNVAQSVLNLPSYFPSNTGTLGIGANLPTLAVWLDAIEREILLYNIALNSTQLNTVDTYLTCENGT